VAEGETHIPFAIARTYWTYDVPGGESRGGHAHKECQEFIIAASGSFSVTLDNGEQKKTYHLNHPWEGLFVDVNIWRTLDDFSSGSLCLVLASQKFKEEITIAGNLKDMFRDIIAIGSDQLVRGATRCGSILLSRMTVAGE
jgi:hypothetical protein